MFTPIKFKFTKHQFVTIYMYIEKQHTAFANYIKYCNVLQININVYL